MDERCMCIEGIGRVHVLGPLRPPPLPPGRLRDAQGRFRYPTEWECAGPSVALADAPKLIDDAHPQRTLNLTALAADIVAGDAPGRILWSVRVKTKKRDLWTGEPL